MVEAQVQNMLQQMQQLTTALQAADQRSIAAETRAANAENMVIGQTNLSTQLQTALAALPTAIATATNNKTSQNRVLVDQKGLGKPPFFDNTEKGYLAWSRKTESYITSIFPNSKKILMWAAEQDTVVGEIDVLSVPSLAAEFSQPEVKLLNEQVHAALMALTNAESFDIVLGTGGEGIEAWRRMARRWDPLTAGRARGLLREILAPARSTIGDLQGSLEKLEELFRRYTSRRDTGGTMNTLNDDIRMSALEALLPAELERHVQLNRARLATYDALRTEVVMYAETRSIGHGRGAHGGGGRDDPMDVGSLWKRQRKR